MADLTVSNDIDNFMQSANNAAARNSLGLSNVDNTSDANKPVSTAQQAADNRRAFAGGVALAAAGKMRIPAGANDFGTGDFTISIDRLHLDDYTPGTAGELYASHSTGNNRLQITIQTDGDWRLTFTDNAAAPTTYDITPTTALPDYPVSVALVADRDSNATLYVDGDANGTVDISAASAIDIGSGNTLSGELMADANLSGIVEGAAQYNRALSSAEAAELSEIGIEAWLAVHPEDKWGLRFADPSTNMVNGAQTWTTLTPSPTGFVGTSDGSSRIVLDRNYDPEVRGHIIRVDFDVTALTGGTLQVGFADTTIGPSENLIGGVVAATTITGGSGGTTSSLSFNVTSTGHVSFLTDFTAAGALLKDDIGLRFLLFESGESVTVENITVAIVGALAAYPMTEGNGRQLRDLSGRYDALLSETGYQHLKPKTEGYVRVKGADAKWTSIFMLEASDTIPADSVITAIIAEERKVDVDNTAQDLADRRIHLRPSGSNVEIQRSDGTNDTTLGIVTAPTDTGDVDVEVHYKQVIR